MTRPEVQEEATTLASEAHEALRDAVTTAYAVPSFSEFSEPFSADIPQAHKQGMYEQYSKLMKSLLDHGMEASRLAVQQEPISSELNRYTVGASTTAINETSLKREIESTRELEDRLTNQIQEYMSKIQSKAASLRQKMGLPESANIEVE